MFKHCSEPSPALIKGGVFFFFKRKTPIPSGADLAPSRPDVDTEGGGEVGGRSRGHAVIALPVLFLMRSHQLFDTRALISVRDLNRALRSLVPCN